jgi:hypothetical protein
MRMTLSIAVMFRRSTIWPKTIKGEASPYVLRLTARSIPKAKVVAWKSSSNSIHILVRLISIEDRQAYTLIATRNLVQSIKHEAASVCSGTTRHRFLLPESCSGREDVVAKLLSHSNGRLDFPTQCNTHASRRRKMSSFQMRSHQPLGMPSRRQTPRSG